MHILPRRPAPELKFDLASGGTFDLISAQARTFNLIIMYRGLHCPLCKIQLLDAQARIVEFAQRGVKIIAVSMDSKGRAEQTKADWGLGDLDVGYGLSEDSARAYGLYLSHGRDGTREPALFSEPGLFLIRTDGTLYAAFVQSAPFTRPPLDQLLQAVDFILEKGYPARGEVA